MSVQSALTCSIIDFADLYEVIYKNLRSVINTGLNNVFTILSLLRAGITEKSHNLK